MLVCIFEELVSIIIVMLVFKRMKMTTKAASDYQSESVNTPMCFCQTKPA